jgi:hypothetical protein
LGHSVARIQRHARHANLSAEEVKKAVEPCEADQDEIDRDNIVSSRGMSRTKMPPARAANGIK